MQEMTSPVDELHHHESTPEDSPQERRSFLKKALAVVVGSVIVAVPALTGLFVFIDPLRRKSGEAKFIPVARTDALPEDGTPVKFQVSIERVDAWNRSRDVEALYVRRAGAGKVVAFSVKCPHAGCPVDWAADKTFKCPCHNSSFNADGSMREGSVSPRGMDELDVDPAALKEGIVRVKYQNFLAGTHEKIVKL
jgi:menaquinol-cytochrome c reductase iron-sulfur subunit